MHLLELKSAFFPRLESIEKMESDFKNCHMFLVTILNKAVCRGSFPHCEYTVFKYYCFYTSVLRVHAVVSVLRSRMGVFTVSDLESSSALVPCLELHFQSYTMDFENDCYVSKADGRVDFSHALLSCSFCNHSFLKDFFEQF